MIKLTHAQVDSLAREASMNIQKHLSTPTINMKVFPVPRGGVPAALALRQYMRGLKLVDDPAHADFIFDDIIDSGGTRAKFTLPFFALINKLEENTYKGSWIQFPWEESAGREYEEHVVRLLEYVGEDPTRGGLKETPARVSKAWAYWCNGYSKKADEILKVFEDGAESYDQMITVQDIPIYSHCEHHLAPIFGTATISYIPNGKIVGLSKLSRLADMFARRLQVQERLTSQIATALHKHLEPKGVGVCIKARHLCMESRGVCQQGHQTITTALTGVLLDDPSAKAEFLRVAI